ncbi:MAG TPA: hypothetical protein VIG50_03985 [Vicinamibacteria bacterium]
MKQLMTLHQRQGTAKPAAGGWIGAVYALRAASRLDANREWGKLGDEIISHLEQAYIAVLGPDAAKGIDAGRELLQTQRKPEATLHVPSDTSSHEEVVSHMRRASASLRKAGGRKAGRASGGGRASARGRGRAARAR